MKKLCYIFILLMLSSIVTVTASAAKFDDKDEMSIVYLGGSITAGTGLTEGGNSWATNVGNWFTETYADTTVNNFNVGAGGTGSDYGFYRLGEEVISKNPNVVFVEFAVNDQYLKDEAAQLYMDGIVQSLQKMDEAPYIVFVFTASKDYVNSVDASEYHKAVAEYYGIPYIDLQTDALEPFVKKGGNITTLFADAVHPSNAGYQLYTDCILEKLKTEGFLKKSAIKETNFVKATYGNKGIDFYAPRYEAISKAKYTTTGKWETSSNRLYTEEAGATLTYNFYGPAIGINSVVLTNGAMVQCEIDGVPVDVFDSYASSSFRTLIYEKHGLYRKEHTLKITVLDKVNAGNITGKNRFDISGFYISDGESERLQKLTAKVNDNTGVVTISGITPIIDGQPISLGIWKAEDFESENFNGKNAVMLNQTVTSDNKISYTYPMAGNALSGKYYVRAKVLNENEVAYAEFLYTNLTRQEEAKKAINKKELAIKELLDKYLMDVDASKGVEYAEFSDDLKDYLVDELTGYTDYDDFLSKLEDAYTKIDLLDSFKNSFDDASVVNLLSNAKLLGLTDSAVSDYNNVLSSGMRDYAMLYFRESVKKNATTPSDIPGLFTSAVNQAKDGNNQDDTDDAEDDNETSNNTGNRYTGVTYGKQDIVLEYKEDNVVFDDIENVAWAKDAILTLAEKGIINGKGNNKFCPNDGITREEYLKIIMVAFEIENDNAALAFEDVNESDWCYDYVAQAVKHGLINGISDTLFGKGMNITRQDMAVILKRAVDSDRLVETYTVDSSFKFNDIDQVSDYAKEAVEEFGKAKIFNGKENNMFDPHANATRAEAVMIIYNLLFK